ncbi:MAG: metallophosphoesterase family protein [Bryobacteraceae bacterium]
MRILIVSDLHANLEAVSVLPADYDQLWVLGDLVNYGPNPHEVIEFVWKNASLVVRGNHDNAIGFDTDPRCSGPYKAMAVEMGRVTQTLISEEERGYLRNLPLIFRTEVPGDRFHLCHATPTDPLFAYRPPESAGWEEETRLVKPGYLLVGHTHLQFAREVNGRIIVNPGSVGQPKMGAPRAAFAIWEDGALTLHSSPYDFEKTIEKIGRLDISTTVKMQLIEVLRNGTLPPAADGIDEKQAK